MCSSWHFDKIVFLMNSICIKQLIGLKTRSSVLIFSNSMVARDLLAAVNEQVRIKYERRKSHFSPWNPSNGPAEPIGLDTFLAAYYTDGLWFSASWRCRGVGQYQASWGLYSTGRGLVEICAELHYVDHELSFSVPCWLTRGSLCDTNFALSTAPLSGHGWLTGPILPPDQR